MKNNNTTGKVAFTVEVVPWIALIIDPTTIHNIKGMKIFISNDTDGDGVKDYDEK